MPVRAISQKEGEKLGETERRNSVPSRSPVVLDYADVMKLRAMLESSVLDDEAFIAQYAESLPNGSFHEAEMQRKKELLGKLSSAPEFHGRTF